MILAKDPRQFQFDFALWTRAIVRDLIAAKFGVTYSVQQVGNILAGDGTLAPASARAGLRTRPRAGAPLDGARVPC